MSSAELTPLQKAAIAVRELRARLDAAEAARREPIAIVGMACRFPGADGCEAYWRLLEDGVDAIREVPADRWDLERLYDPNPNAPGRINTRYGGFLDRVDGFDAAFFGVPPQEAERMDPQQRLLLELVWHALEDAGIPPASVRGTRAGVFVGITQNDYGTMQMGGPMEEIGAYTGTGNGFCFAAGRIAYVFGLQGPTWAVDTACSSSLVALHQASQSLREGECDLAIVAGVQLNLAPQMQVFLARTQSFAVDGRCRSFDESAAGFVLSEGVGVVVLRRGSDARARGDSVRALVVGSAVNHGGPAAGLTVPSESAQESLVRDALARARLTPDDIDFVEAHGSATELGDPIEAGALRSVFGAREGATPLRLGSVKSNIGHLSAAAGVAGLIKVVLMLEHQTIAPNLHFRKPSSRIEWDGFGARVPTVPEPWPRGERPRRAGVSSFGLSGTNAHILIEEAPAPEAEVEAPPRSLQVGAAYALTLSAFSASALRALAGAYARRLPEVALQDFCATANTGRASLPHRLALVARDADALRSALQAFATDGTLAPDAWNGAVPRGGPGRMALCLGDAAPVAAIHALAAGDPVVAEVLARCERARAVASGGALPAADKEAAVLSAQLALGAVLRARGLEPDAVCGVGIGEIAALQVAGVLSIEQAFSLLAGDEIQGDAARGALFVPREDRWQDPAGGELHRHRAHTGSNPGGGALVDAGGGALVTRAQSRLATEGYATFLSIGVPVAQVEAPRAWIGVGATEADLRDAMLALAARVWVRGFAIDWSGFDAAAGRSRVRLPRYPFEERRFWLATEQAAPLPPAAPVPAMAQDAGPVSTLQVAPQTAAAGPSDPFARLLARQAAVAGATIDAIAALQREVVARRFMPSDQVTAPTGSSELPASKAPVDEASVSSMTLDEWHLLRLAGADEAALDAQWHDLADSADDVSWSARHGDGPQRRILVHRGREDALAAQGTRRVISARAAPDRSVVFMFPGVGDQYPGMARGLYAAHPGFRSDVDRCCALLAPLLGVDLREVMMPAPGEEPAGGAAKPDLRAMLGRGAAPETPEETRLNRTVHCQPAIFVIEYALARLWMSCDVRPAAMIGYSIGEYAAACIAGVISLEDALTLVARRARMIETLPEGRLLAVPLSAERVTPLLGGDLALALASTPAMSVVGGPEPSIAALELRLKAADVVARRLPGTHAFHTPMLAPLHDELVALVSGFRLRPPSIPYVANLDGQWVDDARATDPVAWARHTWQPVRFADGMAKLLAQEGRVFLEVGPGQSLGSFVMQHPAAQRLRDKTLVASLRNRYERQPDASVLLTAAGRLWLAGIEVSAGRPMAGTGEDQ